MLAVAAKPTIRERIFPISVETYHRLGELQLIPRNVELIRGAIVEKMSKGPLHSTLIEDVRDWLLAHAQAGFVVRQEQPLTLRDSEPEPDVALARGERRDYTSKHPSTAELVVEVSVSSEELDREKAGIYAEAGVPEYWILLAKERVVERHTEPHGDVYQRVERAEFPAQLASTIIAGFSLPAPDWFGLKA